MTSHWQSVLMQCKYKPKFIPILLSILRLAICFWPQNGYLHPDEFFQASDIVGGNYFHSKVQPVWEFQTDKPIRCMLIPNVLLNLAFKIATCIQSRPSAYTLLVAPRVAYTLLSFIVDICLYKLGQYYSQRGMWCLPVSVIFQSSFVCLGCLTRTLNNTIEVVLFALLLVACYQAVRPRFRIVFVTPTRSTPVPQQARVSRQVANSILVGFLVTLGIFNRPTFICFALIPCTYWLFESFKRNAYRKVPTVQRVVVPAFLSAMLSAILISAYDTVYYRGTKPLTDLIELFQTMEFDQFYTKLSSSWILTPYNFIQYNTNVDNLSKYGLHPPYTHILVNIPLAFNLLGIAFYMKLFDVLTSPSAYRLVFNTYRTYTFMLLSALTPTILLSFIPHQEFRFLLPLIIPLTYVFAFNIYTNNRLLIAWLATNLALTFFYTSVHQAGVTRAMLDIAPSLKSAEFDSSRRLNVLALRCYIAPSYQWNIPADDERFDLSLQDTFDEFGTSLRSKIDKIVRDLPEYPQYSHEMFIMLPQLYESQLADELKERYAINSTRIKTLKQYAMHFSQEELTKGIQYCRKNGWSQWRKAFGFSLMQVDLN